MQRRKLTTAVCLALGLVQLPAQAQFDSTLELSDLNGVNGFTINGVAASDQSGISVSAAGDINGDGIDDLIIKARILMVHLGLGFIIKHPKHTSLPDLIALLSG